MGLGRLRLRGVPGGRLAVRRTRLVEGESRQHEEPIAPDDRRSEAVAVDRDLEADVLPLAPADRRVAVGADPVEERLPTMNLRRGWKTSLLVFNNSL